MSDYTRRGVFATVEFKVCAGCKEMLPAAAFSPHKGTTTGLQGSCKVCRRKINRRSTRKRCYGVDDAMHAALIADQDARCAICRAPFVKEPTIDHCHATGRVRGLLCLPCNTGIGMLGDDPARVRAAAAYLESPA